jgi:hypothetical protein
VLQAEVDRAYNPHLSFAYGRFGTDALAVAADHLSVKLATDSDLSSGFEASEMALVVCHGDAYQCWSEASRFQLGGGSTSPPTV